MDLRIRRFKGSDLQALYELLSDEEVMRYIEPPYSFEQTEAFLETAGLSDAPLIYAVEKDDGLFIGYVISHDYDEDSKEIGWVLKRSFWGKGYAEALTEMLIEEARSEGKAAVIECSPEQQLTKHIAEKSGFIHIGQREGCDIYKHNGGTGQRKAVMRLYHAGFRTIKEPDVRHGRKNADFGQGFYLTSDPDFAHRWARERKGEETVVNTYELDTEGLTVHRFKRDAAWFDYIFSNRNREPDELAADVVFGPVANDTIYDTFGIITSGFLKPEDAMRLLLIGPEYHQVVLKTEKAAGKLKWLSSEVLSPDEVARYRAAAAKEEAEYQELFAEEFEKRKG